MQIANHVILYLSNRIDIALVICFISYIYHVHIQLLFKVNLFAKDDMDVQVKN